MGDSAPAPPSASLSAPSVPPPPERRARLSVQPDWEAAFSLGAPAGSSGATAAAVAAAAPSPRSFWFSHEWPGASAPRPPGSAPANVQSGSVSVFLSADTPGAASLSASPASFSVTIPRAAAAAAAAGAGSAPMPPKMLVFSAPAGVGGAEDFTFVRPAAVFAAKQRDLRCGVSPLGELLVVGGLDGFLQVWDARTGEVLRDLAGHVSDVLACRFFPSGKVILSAGSDFSIRIWHAVHGYTAATILGHRRGVTATGVIDRGRQIISSSLDGTGRMWQVSTQQEIAVMCRSPGGVRDCDVADDFHACAFAEEAGRICLADVRTPGAADCPRVGLSGPACAVRFAPASSGGGGTGRLLYAGCEGGALSCHDLRRPEAPLWCFSRSAASIEALAVDARGVWCTTADGMCFFAEARVPGRVLVDLTGADCDPLRGVDAHVAGGRVYTACRDGFVRAYDVEPSLLSPHNLR